MTIDERLDRLVERHEALARAVELLAIEIRELRGPFSSLSIIGRVRPPGVEEVALLKDGVDQCEDAKFPAFGRSSCGENVCPRIGLTPKTAKNCEVTRIASIGFGRSPRQAHAHASEIIHRDKLKRGAFSPRHELGSRKRRDKIRPITPRGQTCCSLSYQARASRRNALRQVFSDPLF